VACVSDLIAVGAVHAAAAAGLVVGQDVAVTGYDDGPLAPFLNPPLTSIRQPIGDVGRAIVRLLLGELRGEPQAPRGVLLNPRLVVRSSSGVGSSSGVRPSSDELAYSPTIEATP
jgi:DNA-binding LacI/PurR family transcriptional regulator